MNELERELRERTDVDRLSVVKIQTIAEGRELVEKITASMSELINELRDGEFNNQQSQCYYDVRYDLKTARSNLQSQMTRLVKLKHQ